MIIRTIPAGDLALVDGDVSWISGLAHRRQQIATRFQFVLGEWFLDERLGLDYFGQIFVKDPNLDVVRSLFRNTLLKSDGVLTVPTFELVIDPETRSLGFKFQAITDAGPLTISERDQDFLLTF